jgi:hypothetical protein
MQPPRGYWRRAAFAIARRPSLWSTAVVQLVRCTPSGWWRRPPFVPRPDPAYIGFRLTTQYGAADPDPEDVVTYLTWCRDDARGRRGSAGPGSAGRPARHRR